MRVVAVYSFNNGKSALDERYAPLLKEIYSAIETVDSAQYKTKVSKEKTMPGRMLFDPTSINKAFKSAFAAMQWSPVRVQCDYPTEFYVAGYEPHTPTRSAFREMDFLKQRLGVEVQFGKYAFMVYNVCAKMTIFKNLGHIDCGVEIVPVKSFAAEMSTGVSYFEQFVWDLNQRGVSDIDIPVLILGIDA